MIARALLAAALFVASPTPKAAPVATKPVTTKTTPVSKPAPVTKSAPAPKAPAPTKPAPKPAPAPKGTVLPKTAPTPPVAPAQPKPAPSMAAPPAPTPSAAAPSSSPSTPPPSTPEASSHEASAPDEVKREAAPGADAKEPARASTRAPASEPSPAALVVDVRAPASGPAWFASALEQVLVTELLRFHSIELAPKIDETRCLGHETRCLVDAYRDAKVDIVVLGALQGDGSLRYTVYETWTGTRASTGAIRVSGVPMATLEREVGEIVRPIVQRGGLVEQKPVVHDAHAPPAASPVVAPSPVRQRLLAVVAGSAALLMALPILLAFVLVGGRELARRETPASWKWSALLVAVFSTTLVTGLFVDLPTWIALGLARAPRLLTLLPPALAGVLWGSYALTIGGWIFAPIHGLERLRHEALGPLLKSWTLLAMLRAAALLAVYAPVFFVTYRVCSEAELDGRTALALVAPTVGLLVHFWFLSLVDNLTVYLDLRLTEWPPTTRNPWHATLKRYFRGYVQRGVVPVGEALVERTLFLPGERPDVLCYGGGFARPRIVVGTKPLETALGELPDEEELPDRTVNPDELPVGILVPSRSAADDLAELARAEHRRDVLTRLPPRGRAHVPRLLGENATLLGWVLPRGAAVRDGIPLISDTEEDFGVVKRLLSEHYSAFLGNIDDDEVDDTDPSQKDFLFGALLREMGVIARHDVLFATLRWSLVVTFASGGFFARLVRLPVSLYDRFLSLPGANVADAYAALNGALHPLIQYLCFLRGKGEKLLTARANVPRLQRTSREMVAEMEREAETAEELDAFRATPRDRVLWLTRIFYGPVTAGRVHWVRVLVAASFGLVLSVLLVRSVSDAITYHPTYVERMKAQAAKSSEGDNAR